MADNLPEKVLEKEQSSLDTGNLSDHSVFQLVKVRINAVLKTGRKYGKYSNSAGFWKRLE